MRKGQYAQINNSVLGVKSLSVNSNEFKRIQRIEKGRFVLKNFDFKNKYFV